MRSWLYCPGNKPGMMKNAGIYGSDGIVLDLEDAVAVGEKDEARTLVSGALRSFDFGPVQVVVRINSMASVFWRDDLEELVPAGATVIRLPKVESPGKLLEVSDAISDMESKAGLDDGKVKLQAIIETPGGILNARDIAAGSPRLTGLSFGAEDYCASMGISRTGPVYALDYPRSVIACAAVAAGIEAWDTVWSDYSDIAGLEADSRRARSLGFSGKSVIHPDQIETVNRVFSPDSSEIAWAQKVVQAAGKVGVNGAFSIDGSMIDAPVIARAKRILLSSGDSSA